MGKICPVATQTGVTAIKDGRCREVVGVREPVPIRSVALVAAFISQGLLVCPREVPMPCEEVSLKERVSVTVMGPTRCADESKIQGRMRKYRAT